MRGVGVALAKWNEAYACVIKCRKKTQHKRQMYSAAMGCKGAPRRGRGRRKRQGQGQEAGQGQGRSYAHRSVCVCVT